jgi:hypothetical protein
LKYSQLIKLSTLLLYASSFIKTAWSAEPTFTEANDNKTLVHPLQPYELRTSTNQSYALMMSDKQGFLNFNFQPSSLANDEFITLVKDTMGDLVQNISRGCGAELSQELQMSYDPECYVGRGRLRKPMRMTTKTGNDRKFKTTYAGLLMRGFEQEKNVTFENCIKVQMDMAIFYILKHEKDLNQSMKVNLYCKAILALVIILVVKKMVDSIQLVMIVDNPLAPMDDSEPSQLNAKRLTKIKMDDADIPEKFLCKINLSIMDDPVRTADSIPAPENLHYHKYPSYERTAIVQWLRSNNQAPHSGLALNSRAVFADSQLKLDIEKFIETGESMFAEKKQIKEEHRARILRARAK